jgi:protein gp37
VSCEPLLSDIHFGAYIANRNHIDWVICGGESGPRARPMKRSWVRSLRDQCKLARVPFFFKQWGAFGPGHQEMFRQRNAGRLLDGFEHSEFPEVA